MAAGRPASTGSIIPAVPVFVDVGWGTTWRPWPASRRAEPRKPAVMLANTMGCRSRCGRSANSATATAWLVEEQLRALGSRYAGRPDGTYGTWPPFSFYPAITFTMGEGGAVAAADDNLARIARSSRLGARLLCPGGKSNTCGKRSRSSSAPSLRYDTSTCIRISVTT